MENSLPYIEWRPEQEDLTPANKRIGNDVRLIELTESPTEIYEPYKLKDTVVNLVTRGHVCFEIDMRPYDIEAPFLVVQLSGHTRRFISHSKDIEHRTLMLSDSFIDELFKESKAKTQVMKEFWKEPVVPLKKDSLNVFLSYYKMMEDEVARVGNRHRKEAVKHLIITLLSGHLQDKRDEGKRKPSNRNEALAENFLALLHEKFKEERTQEFYAAELHVTPRYLSRIVKSVTNKPVTQWIDDFVVTETKALLRSTDKTLEEIASEFHFINADAFGKYFKRVAGCSPKVYRESF